MTKEEAKKFGLQLLHGIMERNESYPVYANNVKQAIDALSESGSSEIPNDLEEAAKAHRSTANYGGDINLAMEDSYKKGAKWDREQMMRSAVEGEVIKTDKHTSVRYKSFYGTYRYFYGIADKQFKPGDKGRIIFVKED